MKSPFVHLDGAVGYGWVLSCLLENFLELIQEVDPVAKVPLRMDFICIACNATKIIMFKEMIPYTGSWFRCLSIVTRFVMLVMISPSAIRVGSNIVKA